MLSLLKNNNYNYRSKIYIYFVLFIFLTSCNWFDTRTPEAPNSSDNTYPPATSSNILLSNFQKSIEDKSLDKYIQCFADSVTKGNRAFKFSASPDALTVYGNLFENWDINAESKYFRALTANINNIATQISLVLSNSKYDILMPDSAVYVSDYKLSINANNTTSYYSGTLHLSMAPDSKGFWYINNWIDYNKVNDTIKSSWSVCKAIYYN